MKMESTDKLKETNIKNRLCFYFDDIMRVMDIDFNNILSDKKSHNKILEIFQCIAFHTKLLWVKNHSVVGLVK